MRSLFLAYAGASMLAACSFNATGLTATTNLTGEDTTGTSTTAASTTTDPTTGGGTGDVCSPGTPAPCACPFGEGQHTCNPDGDAYGPCDCPDDPTTSTTSSTTAVDPDTSAGTSTSGAPDTTSSTTGDPDTSSTGDESSTSSSSTSTTGDETTSSESSSGGDESTTGEPMCKQTETEPNAPVAMALSQPEIQCGQGKPGGMIVGVLDGDQDIDWWKYHGDYDSPQCNNTNPTMIYSLNADNTARLCVFADCDAGSGTATVMCSVGQTVTDPDVPGGFGCCGMGNFQFEFNCDGGDDESAEVYMRLDGAKADTCVHYTVTYDYQDK